MESQECGLVVCYYAWRLAEERSLKEISTEVKENRGYHFFQKTVESVLQPPKNKTEKLKVLTEINQSDESDNESEDEVEVIIGTPPSFFLPSLPSGKTHSNKRTYCGEDDKSHVSKKPRVAQEEHQVSTPTQVSTRRAAKVF